MHIIALIYKKLLAFFKYNYITNTQQKKEEYIASLSFYLTKNKEIDTVCIVPDVGDKTLDELSDIAHNYAKFLMYINEGYLREDIFSILDEEDKKPGLTEPQKAKNKLFIDNVLFNWALIHVEHQKAKKNNKNSHQPLVRPISVFSPS